MRPPRARGQRSIRAGGTVGGGPRSAGLDVEGGEADLAGSPQPHARPRRLPRDREGPGKRLGRSVAGRPQTRAQGRAATALTSTHLWASANASAQPASTSCIAPGLEQEGERRVGADRGRVPRASAAAPAAAPSARRPGSPCLCCAPQLGKISNLQELGDVAFSELLKATPVPQGRGQRGRAAGGGARLRQLLRLQKSLGRRRPPRVAPPQPTLAAASVRPPAAAPGFPAATAFAVTPSGPGDATVRRGPAPAPRACSRAARPPQLRPEGMRPRARILPASARRAAFPPPWALEAVPRGSRPPTYQE